MTWPLEMQTHLVLDHAVECRQVKLAVPQIRRLQGCDEPRLLQLLIGDVFDGPGVDPAAAGACPPVLPESHAHGCAMNAAA